MQFPPLEGSGIHTILNPQSIYHEHHGSFCMVCVVQVSKPKKEKLALLESHCSCSVSLAELMQQKLCLTSLQTLFNMPVQCQHTLAWWKSSVSVSLNGFQVLRKFAWQCGMYFWKLILYLLSQAHVHLLCYSAVLLLFCGAHIFFHSQLNLRGPSLVCTPAPAAQPARLCAGEMHPSLGQPPCNSDPSVAGIHW